MDWTSLHPSIGRLQSLQELFISQSIESLPPSIGRLQSLQKLVLSHTDNLTRLPDEIGNLASLIKLDLRRSNIESLPASIGRLRSLQYLDLRGTSNLTRLPDEIGNLAGLKELNLQASNIESLSSSVKYNLVCNRFTYRAAMAPVETRLITRGLPLLLDNARRSFRFDVSGLGDIGLNEPEAIYFILTHFRGHFVEAIQHRDGTENIDGENASD